MRGRLRTVTLTLARPNASPNGKLKGDWEEWERRSRGGGMRGNLLEEAVNYFGFIKLIE